MCSRIHANLVDDGKQVIVINLSVRLSEEYKETTI